MKAIDVLKNELKCIKRQNGGICDNKRDCQSCDLVMDDKDIIFAYEKAISALKKKMPKKPIDDFSTHAIYDDDGNYLEQFDITIFKCPIFNHICNSLDECGNKRILTTSALDLINSQKAENKRLLQKLQQAQSEAIKEFAERLKNEALKHKIFPLDSCVDIDDINNLVKEMTEA